MEYRKRCKVCGKIWCYTDEDLKNDTVNNVTSFLDGVGGVASALGGNIFQRQYFADRMENDERKRVNRNQCPNCNSLDCEEISAEELEDYTVKESFAKVQVSINSNATTETLLMRAKLLLEDKDWASANAYCDSVLDTEPQNGTAYLYKLMAELKVSQQEELKDKSEPFDTKATYQKVMRFADEAIKQTLISYNEQIKARKENERIEKIYKDARSCMESAISEKDFKEVAETFGTILSYKDAKTLQLQCREKAEQVRLEAERRETAAKAKKKAIMVTLAVVIVLMLVVVFFVNGNAKKTAVYDKAVALEEAGEYKDAIRTFMELEDYEDSAERVTKVQETAYEKIFVLLDNGKFSQALDLCKDLGEYKDCAKLSQQLENEINAYNRVAIEPTIIDNTLIEAAKAVVAENQYVKDDVFAQNVNIFDQLCDAQWEYVSGDLNALSDETDNYSIETDMWKEKGWTYLQLYIYFDGKKIYLDSKYGNKVFAQDIYKGVDYTVTLTEEGTLLISADRKGVVTECEYKCVN